MEAGLVVGHGDVPLMWHLPKDRTISFLPEGVISDDPSTHLWYFIEENRDTVEGFAHTHPGRGVPRQSWEDVTTFAAWEQGLGRRLKWWILSEDSAVLLTWKGPERHSYEAVVLNRDPPWAADLRKHSFASPDPSEVFGHH